MMKATFIQITLGALLAVAVGSCSNNKTSGSLQNTTGSTAMVGPTFNADSAYQFCDAQCQFGPRVMNSKAHDDCGEWIVAKFRQFGCQVTTQKATLRGYDATPLQCTNIIASARSDLKRRVLLCAHWDSRPWADNDPDSTRWHDPVLAANDGASGVAVMLEVARLLQNDTTLRVGVDFVCFDAEDWGVPRWSHTNDEDSWALGSRYWATHYQKPQGVDMLYGILLDMVGGQGATFYQEYFSRQYAPAVVNRVWEAAREAGYSSYFPQLDGGGVTDDHANVNDHAGIGCIDIIPFYPDNASGSFGPTWHTVSDDMSHIDRNTLKAVGQTVIQVLFTEQ